MPSSPPTTTDAPAPLLTHREAAAWLGVSERQLDRLKADGSLPFIRVGSRSVRYRPESLAAWAASQETIGGDA